MMGIHSRHTNNFLRKLGKKWGEWENRKHACDDPRAVRGLVDAWCNDRFAVQLFCVKGFEWLAVKRHHSGAPAPTWAELQRIKNELVGPEREAVQCFPKESDLVDEADMYHLWIAPEGEPLPFNFRNVGWK
jgi:hypothetical protein